MDELAVVRHAVRSGVLSEEDAERATVEAARTGRSVLETLVDHGSLTAHECARLSAEVTRRGLGYPASGKTLDAGGVARRTLDASIEVLSSSVAEPVSGFPVGEWDRYTFVRLLGEGGMGQVFLADDPQLGRRVAIKFIRAGSGPHLERFLQEARAQAHVEHDHICRIYEVGRVGDRPYIAMQYVDGEPLDRAAQGLSLEKKLQLVELVALAVHEAHRNGLVHRDIKPANIMVERTASGELKPYLLDFGLAREQASTGLTVTGAVLGTPQFMAPEQASGDSRSVDRRADVYALGATLYAIVSGRPPFTGTSLAVVLRQVLEEVPESLTSLGSRVPADVDAIVMTCLRKEPAERYASARALARDIRHFLDGEPIEARRTTALYRLRMLIARNRAAFAVASVALLLVLGSLAWGAYSAWNSARRARVAQAFGQEVERLESYARAAFTAPRRDVGPYRAQILARMSTIEARMDELGRIALGPGRYALGRGLLVLGQFEAARAQLEAARDAGYEAPEVDLALGRVLGEMYARAYEEMETIPDEAARAERQGEIDRDLRQPALTALRRGRGAALESPAYVEALIALYERDFATALERAGAAFSERPLMYEARALEGRVHMTRAEASGLAGDGAAARAGFADAELALRDAAEIGRSDPGVHLELCRLGARRMRIESIVRAGDPSEMYGPGLEACRTLLEIDASSSEARLTIAGLQNRLAEFRAARGEDPTEVLRAAIEAAREALVTEPENPAAYDILGSTYSTLAQHEMDSGLESEATLRASIAAFESAIEIQARHWRFNDLGIVYRKLSRVQGGRGEEASRSVERAIASYQRSLELNPDQIAAWGNLGQTYFNRAGDEMNRGEDPMASLDEALRAFDRALDLDPDHMVIHYNVARTNVRLADLRASRGEPSDALFERAVASYRKAIAVNPESAHAAHFRNGLGGALCGRAQRRWEEGGDPEPLIAEALDELARARRANPRLALAPYNIGLAELLRSRAASARGADAIPAGRRAIAAFRESIALNASYLPAYSAIGDAALEAARHARARGRPADEFLDEGASAAREALARSPDHVPALVTFGLVELERARGARAVGRSPARSLAAARRAIDRAAALEPDLAFVVGAQARCWLEAAGGPSAYDAVESRDVIARLRSILERNPADDEARALLGAVLLVEAESAADAAARQAQRDAARRELDEAIRRDRRLEREFGRLLERARQTAS